MPATMRRLRDPARGPVRTRATEIEGIFDGPLLPLAARLGLPIALGGAFQLLYTFVDTLFIAQIDPTNTALLAGAGVIFPLFFLFLALGTGIGVGVSTLVSRAIGERNEVAIESAAATGLTVSSGLALAAVGAGLLFGDRIIEAMAGARLSREALTSGGAYLRALLPGLGLMLVGQTLVGIMQGEGRNRYVAAVMVTTTVVNIGLDPLFIFGFGWGVAGAGWATTVSIGVSGILVVALFATGKTTVPLHADPRRVRPALVGHIARIGLPQSLGMLSISVSVLFLNNLVGSISEWAMTAWTMVGRVDQLLIMPGMAMSAATVSVVGQNFGRSKLERVRAAHLVNSGLAAAALVTLAALYVLLARPMFSLFSELPSVVSAAVVQVRHIAFTTLGSVGAMVAASTFMATGRPLPGLTITVIRTGLLSVPLAFLLARVGGLGMQGVYYAVMAGNVVGIVVAWPWVRHHLRTLRPNAIEH